MFATFSVSNCWSFYQIVGQIVGRFSFSKFIDIIMYLDIHHILVHSKNYTPRKAKTVYNLGRMEYVFGPAPIVRCIGRL